MKKQADLAGRSAELQSEIARKAQSLTRYAGLVALTIALCSAYFVGVVKDKSDAEVAALLGITYSACVAVFMSFGEYQTVIQEANELQQQQEMPDS